MTLLVLFWLLPLPCAASLGESFGTDRLEAALPASAGAALGGALTVEDASLDGALPRLLAYLRGQMRGALAEVLRPLAAIAAITLLAAAVRPLLPEREAFDPVGFASCLGVSAAALTACGAVFPLGRETLHALSDFSHALLPTLTAAATAAGAPTSAGVKYAASALFSDLLLTAAERLILPMVSACAAAGCASAVLGGTLDGPVRVTTWSARTLMKALVLCFTAYLSLSGALSSGADAAAVKVAKSALGTLLPVVGRTVADASDALLSGAAILRNSIGAFGLVAALGVLALPVLRLALHYLLFKAAAALLAPAAGGRIAKVLDAVGSACGMLLGLVGSAAVILFLSVFSLIETVRG